MAPRSRSRRRPIAIGLALLGLAGLGLGSAAQLNLTTDTLGAGVEVVASCQGADPIHVGFTTELAGDAYVVSSISLTQINAECANKNLELTVMNDNTPLSSVGATPVVAPQTDVTMTPQPSAAAITKIAVVIAD